MKLLLDSHYAFSWQTGDARLTKRAQRFIKGADAMAVSHVTLWEFTIKAGLGRTQINLPVLAAQVEAMGFEWLLGVDHSLALRHEETIEGHRAPFDRMLAAQSRATLLT